MYMGVAYVCWMLATGGPFGECVAFMGGQSANVGFETVEDCDMYMETLIKFMGSSQPVNVKGAVFAGGHHYCEGPDTITTRVGEVVEYVNSGRVLIDMAQKRDEV